MAPRPHPELKVPTAARSSEYSQEPPTPARFARHRMEHRRNIGSSS
jgi:hypothetical protein